MTEKIENSNPGSEEDSSGYSVICFKLGSEEYGINLLEIQEINKIPQITRVPFTPDFIMGVSNLRGNILTVVDLKKFFQIPGERIDKYAKLIIVIHDNNLLGLIVDRIVGVREIRRESVKRVSDQFINIDQAYIKEISQSEDKVTIILDLEKLLSSPRFSELSMPLSGGSDIG